MHILRHIVAFIMVVGVVGTAALVKTPQIAKAATYDPVILVHGFNSSATLPCDSSSEFGTIESYFRNALPTNLVYLDSVGYYNGDSNSPGCSTQLSAFNSHCTGWYAGNQGTINEDLRHVSCELAWYIWDAYSSRGVHVQVVAHSMGGILIRQAITDTYWETAFPPYLYIDNVVTAGSPHQGLGYGSAAIEPGCWGCTQIAQLEAANALMSNLNSTSFRSGFGRNPGAPGWGSTDWTTMSSTVDSVLTKNPNAYPEWLNLPTFSGGSSLAAIDGMMPGAKHFVIYPCGQVATDSPGPCYDHGGYLTDTNTGWNAYEVFSDNNGGNWTITYTSNHSIFTMYYAILYSNW